VSAYFITEKKNFIADEILHFADFMLLRESHCEGY